MSKLYRIYEFCDSHGISHSTFYRKVNSGRLKVIKCGRRTLIDEREINLWWNKRYKIKRYKPRRYSFRQCVRKHINIFTVMNWLCRPFTNKK